MENTLKDVYSRQSVASARILEKMESMKLTKAELARRCHISRPTLDKLLSGNYANENKYLEYIQPILKEIKETPDTLLKEKNGNVFCQLKALCVQNHMTEKQLSELIGVSLENILSYEQGKRIPKNTCRLLAASLHCHPAKVRGSDEFADMGSFLNNYRNEEDLLHPRDGYWGDVGVLMSGSEHFSWYPITMETCRRISEDLYNSDFPWIMFPTLDFRQIILARDEINEIILVDEAEDAPEDSDWQSNKKTFAPVFYDAISDYACGTALPKVLDEGMEKIVDEFFDGDPEYAWMETVCRLQVLYKNGTFRTMYASPDDLTEPYDFYDVCMGLKMNLSPDDFVSFCRADAGVSYIRLNSVSMLDLPLQLLQDEHDDVMIQSDIDLGLLDPEEYRKAMLEDEDVLDDGLEEEDLDYTTPFTAWGFKHENEDDIDFLKIDPEDLPF